MSSKSSWQIVSFLALAVVVSGLGFAWSVHHRQRYRSALLAKVSGWGGVANRWVNTNPAWDPYRRVLGREFVDSIVGSDGYHLEGPMNHQVEPDQLAQLLEFQPIRSFEAMSASNLSDDWISRIRDPLSVRSLNLGATTVTDLSLPKFLEMKNLQYLSLTHTRTSDDSIVRLLGLPKLCQLEIGGTSIRSIRLLDVWSADDQGVPSKQAGLASRIKGRVAVDPRLGRPPVFEMRAFQSGSPGSFAGTDRTIEEESPGVFIFDMVSRFLPVGRTEVQIVARVGLPGRTAIVSCRLPSTSIEVDESL